jgi:hypothetical protein
VNLPRSARSWVWALATLAAGEAVLERDLHPLGGDGLAWLARIVAATILAGGALAVAWPAAERDEPRLVLAELLAGLAVGALLAVTLVHGRLQDVERGTWAVVGLALGALVGILRRIARDSRGATAIACVLLLSLLLGRFGSSALAARAGAEVLGRRHELDVILLAGVLIVLRVASGRAALVPPAPRRVAPVPGPTLERSLLVLPVVTATLLATARDRPARLASAVVAAGALALALGAVLEGDPAGAGPAVVAVVALGRLVGGTPAALSAHGGISELLPMSRSRAVRASVGTTAPLLAVAVVLGWVLAPSGVALPALVLVVGAAGVVAAVAGAGAVVATVWVSGTIRQGSALAVVAALAGALFVLAPAVQANVGLFDGLIVENVVAASAFGVVVGLAGISFVGWWQRGTDR